MNLKETALDILKKYAILIVVVLMCIYFMFTAPGFFSFNNLMNVLRQASMNCILAVGISLVMISGGIDLSIGTMIALVGIVTAMCMVNLNLPIAAAIPVGILVGVAGGALNAFIVTKLKLNPMIATLATMNIFTGLANIANGGLPVYGFDDRFKVIGQGYLGPIPVPVIIMVVVVLAGSFLLNKTDFGVNIYAVGNNAEAARLSGLNVNRIRFITFLICGFFGGVGGMIMLSRTASASPSTGTLLGMDVLTACVLGGVSLAGGEGKISNAVVGVFALAILNNGMVLLNINDYYQSVIKGIVLILAVAFDMMKNNLHIRSRDAAPAKKAAA